MKTLLLLRHAKSSKCDPDMRDEDRPLNERGFEEAPLIGKYLNTHKIFPERIICSPALRARQTLDLVLKEIDKKIDIMYDIKLYDEDAKSIYKFVSKTDNSIQSLMLIGHNPDISHLAELAIRDDFPYDKFSTSGLVIIEFNIDSWEETILHRGELRKFITPKMIDSYHN